MSSAGAGSTVWGEALAAPLQVLHLVLAVAAVGAATHLVVWLRGHRRGRPRRHAAARRFAAISATLCVATFVLGLVIYPTYRTRVRAEYLDQPTVLADELGRAQVVRAELATRHGVEPGPREVSPDVARARALGAARLTRWFDIKEHWAALTTLLAACVFVVLAAWRTPRRRGDDDDADPHDDDDTALLGPIAFWAATVAAAGLWACAIIGVVLSNTRAM
jgi:cytochrome bd-type quinol oxidase subunit 2